MSKDELSTVRMKRGRVELIVGPMFSGKTSELIRRVSRYTLGKNPRNVAVLKWDEDFRGKEKVNTVRTHNDVEYPCIRVPNKLMNGERKIGITTKIMFMDVIGIDEGHFFNSRDDLLNFCRLMANEYGKTVIISGLDSDFKREPFVEICKLVSECESVTKFSSVCEECSDEAFFSYKKLKSKTGSRIEVGGEDKYSPMCRSCHIKNNNK